MLSHLQGISITGTIKALPEGIGALEFNTAEASVNTAALFAVLSALPELNSLSLRSCDWQLSSTIAGLSALKTLDLRGNGFERVPVELYDLKNLVTLDLSVNALNELPAGIGALSRLKQLNLASNWMNGFNPAHLFAELASLAALQELLMYSCQSVSALPESLDECKKLHKIDLDNNTLSTLPEALFRMSWLKSLRLTTNPLPDAVKQRLRDALVGTKLELDP